MNKRGFTLIELIATLVLLALVMSISGYSIISIINSTKEENYNNLLRNIKDASESYYMECKYSKETVLKMFNNDSTSANSFCDYQVTLGELVRYGYLTGNGTNGNDKLAKIYNPNTEVDISNCEIAVNYNNGKLTITSNSTDTDCPTQEEYNQILNQS